MTHDHMIAICMFLAISLGSFYWATVDRRQPLARRICSGLCVVAAGWYLAEIPGLAVICTIAAFAIWTLALVAKRRWQTSIAQTD